MRLAKPIRSSLYLPVALAGVFFMVQPSLAALVDKRVDDKTIVDAAYHRVAVEDALSAMVPPGYQVEFVSPGLKKLRVTIDGRGTWHGLLGRGFSASGLALSVDTDAKRVVVSPARSSVAGPKIVPFTPPAGPRNYFEASAVPAVQLLPIATPASPVAPTVARVPVNAPLQPEAVVKQQPATSVASVAIAPVPQKAPAPVSTDVPAPAKAVIAVERSAREEAVKRIGAKDPGHEWPVVKGTSFEQTLSAWAKKANWGVQYDEDVPKLRLLGSYTFKGSLAEAVSGLVKAIRLDERYRVTLNEGTHQVHAYDATKLP